jgi:Leucine Rich Repeat
MLTSYGNQLIILASEGKIQWATFIPTPIQRLSAANSIMKNPDHSVAQQMSTIHETAEPAWCSYQGVTCNSEIGDPCFNRVIDFSFPESSLTGTLTDLISAFGCLKKFDINNNQIGGTLTSSFSALRYLEHFDIRQNQFTGTIAPYIGATTSLKYLAAGENLFESIPKEFSPYVSLEHLSLNMNSLIGTIPSSIGYLTSLIYLDLSENRLRGRELN